MEMSKYKKNLPRYYKGFDLDKLYEKLRSFEELTDEEDNALREARRIYMEKVFEKRRQTFEETKKNVDRCFINQNYQGN